MSLKNLRKNEQLKFKVKEKTKKKIVDFAKENGYLHTSTCIRDTMLKAADEFNEKKQKLVTTSATC